MSIEINNLTGFKIDKKSFTQVAKKVLSGENRARESLSLAFVDAEEIKKLNKKFRKKNKATDVLSFEIKEKGCLGEIVVCPEAVKKNAEKYGVDFKKELVKVFVHGILHLLGYDHPDEIEDPRQSRDEKSKRRAEEMEKREQEYLLKIRALFKN